MRPKPAPRRFALEVVARMPMPATSPTKLPFRRSPRPSRRDTDNRLDAVVHLAGGFAMSSIADSTPAVWQKQLALNLTTAALTARAFLPLVRASRGAFVFFGSAAALPGASVANMAAYATAKGGVLTLMRALAEEERANGVRANALAPTSIRTAANEKSMGSDARYVERDDVARMVVWLCSDASRPMTGQVIALG